MGNITVVRIILWLMIITPARETAWKTLALESKRPSSNANCGFPDRMGP